MAGRRPRLAVSRIGLSRQAPRISEAERDDSLSGACFVGFVRCMEKGLCLARGYLGLRILRATTKSLSWEKVVLS